MFGDGGNLLKSGREGIAKKTGLASTGCNEMHSIKLGKKTLWEMFNQTLVKGGGKGFIQKTAPGRGCRCLLQEEEGPQ